MSFTCPLCGGALHSMNEHGIWYKECAECRKRFEFLGYQWIEIGTNDRTDEEEAELLSMLKEAGWDGV